MASNATGHEKALGLPIRLSAATTGKPESIGLGIGCSD